ncbi:MAG: type II toxin-antitoxin system RelB/DinJ family antitoxin [Candidatus Yanofskybacteria bacterium]|nr:type II toxin-antitoxin system RelB/DinJ family antitoxin [Candidatus Yanofskybacteria bacterium]
MTTLLSIRIDPKIKAEASKTLGAMGLDTSSAVKLFLNQVIIDQELPFKPSRRSPKEIRAEWDKEVAEVLRSGRRYKGAKALMRTLDKVR